ncbi:hypothetical protein ACWEO2_30185 [Nocardia sp. NPDC004278]
MHNTASAATKAVFGGEGEPVLAALDNLAGMIAPQCTRVLARLCERRIPCGPGAATAPLTMFVPVYECMGQEIAMLVNVEWRQVVESASAGTLSRFRQEFAERVWSDPDDIAFATGVCSISRSHRAPANDDSGGSQPVDAPLLTTRPLHHRFRAYSRIPQQDRRRAA